MANAEHVKRLVESDKESWNSWRMNNPYEPIDLRDENLEWCLRRNSKVTPEGLADLRGFDLRMTFLHEAILSNTDLSGAVINAAFPPALSAAPPAEYNKVGFVGSRLVGTTLRNVRLNECVLTGADLSGADLTDAKLPGSYLEGANLGDAKLRGTDFTDTDLTGAHLEGADLSSATLVRTNLWHSEVWKAKLFKSTETRHGSQFVNCGCNKLSKVSQFVRRLERTDDVAHPDGVSGLVVYFRGEPEMYEQLRPSLMRHDEFRLAEDRLLIELITRRPEDLESHRLFFQRLVMARHYELPTRLLDITRSPLVGLYYASGCACMRPGGVCQSPDGVLHEFHVTRSDVKPFDSDTVSLLANFTRLNWDEKSEILTRRMNQINLKDILDNAKTLESRRDRTFTRLRHFIAQEKPYWENRIDMRDLFRVLIVEPQRQFDRLRAHSGAFMLSAFHERFERWAVDRYFPGAAPYRHLRFVVPHDAKREIRRQLATLNITEETLMADLQSSAKAVKDEMLGRDHDQERG